MDPFPNDPGTPPKWTPLVEVEHEATVAFPAWLLRVPEVDRPELARYLASLAAEAVRDPEAMAYSIG
jgi:hypothetical protein